MSRYLPYRSFLVLTVLSLLTGGLFSCSQYSTRPISKGYHNLTAHFNAYIIARDQIDEAEQVLFKTRQENPDIIKTEDGEKRRQQLHEWFWSTRSWEMIGQDIHTWMSN